MPETSLPAFDPADLLRDLVALPAPPGQEAVVCRYLAQIADDHGWTHATDAKGNLLVSTGDKLPDTPAVVVTAHMDEIALMVTGISDDGTLAVAPQGGVYPWKWGEGPVEILARNGVFLPGVLSFGSIHTTSPLSSAQQAREGRAPTWANVQIVTGLSAPDLRDAGVRPGTRVCMARSRRTITELGGNLVASYFLDDRADLVAWLLAIETARALGVCQNVLFVATASEEVGGEGALFALRQRPAPVCIALEIGPTTPDNPFPTDANPTVWVSDTYATMTAADLDMVADAATEVGLRPWFHAVTRGGSDATLAASHGLCARPITLAFAADNSHGYEVMHRDAPRSLALLLSAVLRRLAP